MYFVAYDSVYSMHLHLCVYELPFTQSNLSETSIELYE